MNYNRAILVGRVGSGSELRATPQGIPVATFLAGHHGTWKDKATGERQGTHGMARVVAFQTAGELRGETTSRRGSPSD